MHDFLMDMKALNLQNRTFAIIETLMGGEVR